LAANDRKHLTDWSHQEKMLSCFESR